MKFIPTAQKVYTNEEIKKIMMEIVVDMDSDLFWSDEKMAAKYADFEIPEALLNNVKGDLITLQHMLATFELNKYVKEMFDFIIKNGADVNVKDLNGNTPLHYIFRTTFGLPDTARYLLENNADINAENSNGQSPLYFALIHNSGMNTAMELVTNYGAKITPVIVDKFSHMKGFDALRNMQHQSTSSNKITALENHIKELKSEVRVLRSDMDQVIELLKGMQLKNHNADDNLKHATTSVRMFGKL